MGVFVSRFLVGAFAGALASFFPRLVAVLGGNPNDNVVLFSHTYVVVGCIVALAVAITVVILENGRDRQINDVFMTGLGVPTLLMGALTTTATTHNANLADIKIQSLSRELAVKSQVPIRDDVPLPAPAALAPVDTQVSLLELIVPSAHAQTGAVSAQASQRGLGITLREPRYTTVYQEARDEAALGPLQQTLSQRGLPSRTVQLPDGRHLLVAEGSARSLSDAVHQGERAKEFGAAPYVVPARR